MKYKMVAVGLVAATLIGAAAAWALPFQDGAQFQKFLKKFGPILSNGRAKRACICNESAPYLRAAGLLDFVYDGSDHVFRAYCLVPEPSTMDGNISQSQLCLNFTVIP